MTKYCNKESSVVCECEGTYTEEVLRRLKYGNGCILLYRSSSPGRPAPLTRSVGVLAPGQPQMDSTGIDSWGSFPAPCQLESLSKLPAKPPALSWSSRNPTGDLAGRKDCFRGPDGYPCCSTFQK